MAACPNCGRQTLRTKDWACQWCGYPLISRAYKKIDKTFKELQEERSLAGRSAGAELEPELEPEPEPEPPPEPKPKPRSLFRHISRPQPEPEAERKPPPPERPVARPEPEVRPEPERRPVLPVRPVARPQPAPEPEHPAEPKTEIPPLAAAQPPPLPAPEPRPEIKIEPEPPPEPPISLESITDGMEITADQLDALYRSDSPGVNSKLTGKTVVVKGIVDKVFVRDHLDIRYIVIRGAGKRIMWSLRCTFNKEDSTKLTRLNEGDAVRVRGKYDGYSKNIMFKDCVLV